MKNTRTATTALTPWGWAAAGLLVGLLVACVVFAPARWLAGALYQVSGQHLQLTQTRGSVWHGSGQLVLSGGMGSRDAVALPGTLTWQINPTWRGVQALVNADCCTPSTLQLQAALAGWGGLRLTLTDAPSHWPAALLSGLGTPWNTIAPQGELALSTQGFEAQWVEGRLSLAGHLQVDALRMASRLSTLSPIGSYRITLLGGATPTLQIQTLEGSLQLSGQGQWVGQRLHLRGEASAAPDRVEALSNLLNIIGRRSGARSIITVG